MTGFPSYPGEKRRLLVFLTLAVALHLIAGGAWLVWAPAAPQSTAGTLRIGLVMSAAPAALKPVTPVTPVTAEQTPRPAPPTAAAAATATATAEVTVSEPTTSASATASRHNDPSGARRQAEPGVAEIAALRDRWYAQVNAQLARQMRYPRLARLRQLEGEALVSFELARDGRLLRSALRQSSGHALLDQAALELLARAAPYPSPPGALPVEDLQLQVPVSYRLPH